MKKIYLDNNYIIIEVDGAISALPIRSTLYGHVLDPETRLDAYSVFYSTVLTQLITVAEIVAGDWTDENLVPYTDATILTFLRTNTGL